MNINDVMTIAEASKEYNVTVSSLRYACTGQKGYSPIFHNGECRQSGKTWLITKQALERVYKHRTAISQK